MNIIWGFMVIISVAAAAATGHLEETANAVFEGASTAVSTLIGLAGAMCFWTGILKITERCGISGAVRRLISPLVKRLFPGSGEAAREYISMNMTANLLGMGNAATPAGMLAAERLDEENGGSEYPSDNMCMLVVLNTMSIQLLPSTVLALRAAAGAAEPASVVVPIWAASVTAAAAGVISVKIMGRFFKK